jgi:hypothetical protein
VGFFRDHDPAREQHTIERHGLDIIHQQGENIEQGRRNLSTVCNADVM